METGQRHYITEQERVQILELLGNIPLKHSESLVSFFRAIPERTKKEEAIGKVYSQISAAKESEEKRIAEQTKAEVAEDVEVVKKSKK